LDEQTMPLLAPTLMIREHNQVEMTFVPQSSCSRCLCGRVWAEEYINTCPPTGHN